MQKNDEEKSLRETIKEQIIAIRDSGETNMFDYLTVQAIAEREGYEELEWYISNRKSSYLKFILTGNEVIDSDNKQFGRTEE